MSIKRCNIFIVCVSLIMVFTGLLISAPGANADDLGSKTYVGKLIEVDVIGIDDGDTIEVYYKGKNWQVRLIGIDTPEIVKDHEKTNHDVEEWNIPVDKVLEMGNEAKKYVKSLIKKGDKVRLEFDENSAEVNGEKVDPYNRLLCYVYLKNGKLLNAELLRKGYARFKTHNWKDEIEFPEKKYQAKFQSMEEEAKNTMAGFWKIWSVAYNDKKSKSKNDNIVTFEKGFSPQQKAAVLEIANAIRSDDYKKMSKYTKNEESAKQVLGWWGTLDKVSNIKFRARKQKSTMFLQDAHEGSFTCDIIKDGNRFIIELENEHCTFNDGY